MANAAELLAGHPLFEKFPAGDLAMITEKARRVSFKARQRIFSEGDPATACWLIAEGSIALDVTVPGRGQVVVQTLGRGEIMGWSWLVPPYRWHLGATALQPSTAAELDAAGLRALAEENPRLGYTLALSMFEILLRRLESTRARLLDLYGSDSDDR